MPTRSIALRCSLSALLLTVFLPGFPAVSAAHPQQNPSSDGQQPAPDNRVWTLSAPHKKDETARYFTRFGMALVIKSPDNTGGDLSAPLGMNLTLRYKVREAQPDGGTQWAAWSEGGQLLDSANDLKPIVKEPEDAPRLLTLDAKNRPLASRESEKVGNATLVDNLFGQTGLLANLHFLPLPGTAIKQGDTWKARYPLPSDKPQGGTVKPAPTDKAESKDDDSQITAEMTLLGAEMIGEGKSRLETLKIRQVLTVPFVAETDDKGRAMPPGKKGAGRMVLRLTFRQTVNALPATGQVLQSVGQAEGTVRFEGAIARLVPGSSLTLSGMVGIARLEEGQDPSVFTPKRGQ